MNAKRYINVFLLLILTVITSCGDSLEDTYKQYAGDGEITYIGKCTDLVLKPGWNRLIATWANNVDARIDKVKIIWTDGEIVKEQLLDRGTTEFNIPELKDLNYEVSVCGVDKNGKESLKITAFGRPYSDAHESILTFTRIISQHILFKDRLVLFFLGWENSVEEAYLTYTKKAGGEGRLDLTPAVVNQLYHLVADEINTNDPITLYRTGLVGETQDRVVFTPIVLEYVRSFSSDFTQEMRFQHSFNQGIPDAWADNVEEVYLDRNITSFIDLLRLPKIKKLILGKHRYVLDNMVTDAAKGQSKLSNAALSNFVINILRNINGLTIERYDMHYQGINTSYVQEKGRTTIPALTYLDLSGLLFTSVPADSESHNSRLDYLTDNEVNSSWDPYVLNESTTFTLTLDLKAVKNLNGIKLVQTYYDQFNVAKRAKNIALIQMRVSENQQFWESPISLEELEIGSSTGETNIIPFKEGGVQARYVQLEFTTPFVGSAYEVSLAEVAFY